MRVLILPLVFAASLLTVHVASAAPTCQTRQGETARCGTPGAMPVGWTLPDEQRAATLSDDGMTPLRWLSLATVIGGLFALIALMPDFDGWGGESDDNEEDA